MSGTASRKDGEPHLRLVLDAERLRQRASNQPAGLDGPAAELWPAWQGLARWEESAEDCLGAGLAEEVLLLWALSRFGGMADRSDSLLSELVDDNLHPRFADPALEDIAHMAFALGASWASKLGAERAGTERTRGDER
ncbi:MAG: hypothetical protein ACR2MY_08950 [Candidatus Dormibacteria bacterium]